MKSINNVYQQDERSSNKGINLSLKRPCLTSLLQYLPLVCSWIFFFFFSEGLRFTQYVCFGKSWKKQSRIWPKFHLEFWFHYKIIRQISWPVFHPSLIQCTSATQMAINIATNHPNPNINPIRPVILTLSILRKKKKKKRKKQAQETFHPFVDGNTNHYGLHVSIFTAICFSAGLKHIVCSVPQFSLSLFDLSAQSPSLPAWCRQMRCEEVPCCVKELGLNALQWDYNEHPKKAGKWEEGNCDCIKVIKSWWIQAHLVW